MKTRKRAAWRLMAPALSLKAVTGCSGSWAVPPGWHWMGRPPVTAFKDNAGAIKRQAARFRVFIYNDASPGGRELKIGDRLQVLKQKSGQIMTGSLTDVVWTVYLANKK